jgi:hypothetical protein
VIQLVISLNIAIALFGFYLAWRIWRVKRVLTAATVALTAWERNTHRALNPDITPALILRGQIATASLRDRYARLEKQLYQLQRIFSLASLGLRLWRAGGLGRRRWSRRWR